MGERKGVQIYRPPLGPQQSWIRHWTRLGLAPTLTARPGVKTVIVTRGFNDVIVTCGLNSVIVTCRLKTVIALYEGAIVETI